MKKVRVVENPKKGDYWDVRVENGEAVDTIGEGLPYAKAYQEKLKAQKRIDAGQLVVQRKPLVAL